MEDKQLLLTLTKEKTILDDIICKEYVNCEILDKLINSDLLGNKEYYVNCENKQFKNDKCKYENEKSFLITYRKQLKSNNDIMHITYKRKEHGFGRTWAKDNISYNMIRRAIRHSLCKEKYIDIDIKNCHPEILKQILIHNKIKCNELIEYCTNRDKILKEVMDFYNCDRNSVKQLFLSMLNGGGFKRWLSDYNIKKSEKLNCIEKFKK